MSLFPDFQYGFRSCQLTTDLLTVVSDRIARAFYSSSSTWYMQVFRQDLACWSSSKTYLLRNFKSDICFYFFFQYYTALDRSGWEVFKRICMLMLEFLKAPFLVMYFSYNTSVKFLMMLSAILQSMVIILLSTTKCD